MILPILTDGAPILRKVATPVNIIEIAGPLIQGLVADMIDTMRAAHGIGLAAPQVGHGLRLVVMEKTTERDGFPLRVLINPVLAHVTSSITQTRIEGCLSVPEKLGEVTRPLGLRVQYLDEQGRTQQDQMSGLEAACLQHELDHLNGILFIDTAKKIRARKAVLSV